MIENALQDEQGKNDFKEYSKSLVEAIADKYATSKSVKGIPREDLVEVGWTHFDLALRNYQDRARLMTEHANDLFYFSTYFTWFVRQGIVEYLIREKIIQNH